MKMISSKRLAKTAFLVVLHVLNACPSYIALQVVAVPGMPQMYDYEWFPQEV